MTSRRALAIVNMLLFVLVFTILSGVTLSLISSHTRLMEADIRRIKGYYVSEAGNVHALDYLRRGLAPPNASVEWTLNSAGGPIAYKAAVISLAAPPAGPYGTAIVNATSNYTFNW